MTNKPTDAEIIKALECCIFGECENCPHDEETACKESLNQEILNLIKRLKAENEALISAQETLQKHIAETEKKYAFAVAEREANVIGFTETINKVKAEAIKEFAERLKTSLNNVARWSMHGDNNEYFIKGKQLIDNLVEETVGENQ